MILKASSNLDILTIVWFIYAHQEHPVRSTTFEGMGSLMRRAEKRESDISALVPKNHFASMSFFREEPLISWSYTKAILFTAYDVYRSSDFWLDSIIKSGKTLKQGLVELGFPKESTMMADTGIFELEAKKAGKAKELGISIDIELSNEQIFEAYELSGADYFVSPDEIILATDTNQVANVKLRRIKDNLLQLLELVDSTKVIGVLQGIKQDRVKDLFDFFRSHGVEKFAIGGLLPLYWHDKDLFKQVLTQTRKLTQQFWLHTFGLPMITLLPFYLQEIGMDSVDTSMLLYLTARRKYLVNVESRPVRLADFTRCSCEGCIQLKEGLHPRQPEFFVNLYIHNVTEASRIACECIEGSWTRSDNERADNQQHQEEIEVESNRRARYKPLKDYGGAWVTADELLDE